MAKKLLALALAMAMASSFACISALAADQGMRFDGVTETITLERKYTVEDAQSAILALNKAKLTINATESGSVKAGLHEEDGLSIAVWSHNAEVVINGGYYENTADDIVDPSHVDLIYASGAGSIVINGGTFVCATPQWTLNCRDNSNSTITVKGGKFYQFNPAEAQVGEGEIVLGEGCKVVKEGDWYKVVTGEAANITPNSTSKVINGDKGALRFVFNIDIPEKTKTYFGAYLLPLNIFNASGVANAVQVQYDTNVATGETFSADLVEIPSNHFETSIYAIPYIKTANGVVTFAGASASVNSALAE